MSSNAKAPLEIRLLSASGRQVVARAASTAERVALDTRTLPAGMYAVSVSAGQERLVKRIVVTR
jgi:hypothetical protein